VADDDELWAPFLAFRPEDRHATRLRRHVEEDMKRGARHVPRRAAALSRDEIVRAAIKVADAEGPDAISMRRIARELNAGTMSLYWHVASKEELLDLMIDSVQGEQLTPEPSGDWRTDLRALTRGARAALHRHPWMVDFMGGRPPTGPKALQNIERALSSLDGLGLFMKLRLPDEVLELGDVAIHNDEVYPSETLTRVGSGITAPPPAPVPADKPQKVPTDTG